MSRVVIDSAMRTLLQDLEQPVELCDEAGRVLGRYVPAFDPAKFEGLDSPVSHEELQHRKQNKGKTYSTAEVLAHLETL